MSFVSSILTKGTSKKLAQAFPDLVKTETLQQLNTEVRASRKFSNRVVGWIQGDQPDLIKQSVAVNIYRQSILEAAKRADSGDVRSRVELAVEAESLFPGTMRELVESCWDNATFRDTVFNQVDTKEADQSQEDIERLSEQVSRDTGYDRDVITAALSEPRFFHTSPSSGITSIVTDQLVRPSSVGHTLGVYCSTKPLGGPFGDNAVGLPARQVLGAQISSIQVLKDDIWVSFLGKVEVKNSAVVLAERSTYDAARHSAESAGLRRLIVIPSEEGIPLLNQLRPTTPVPSTGLKLKVKIHRLSRVR